MRKKRLDLETLGPVHCVVDPLICSFASVTVLLFYYYYGGAMFVNTRKFFFFIARMSFVIRLYAVSLENALNMSINAVMTFRQYVFISLIK